MVSEVNWRVSLYESGSSSLLLFVRGTSPRTCLILTIAVCFSEIKPGQPTSPRINRVPVAINPSSASLSHSVPP
ncbi:hypothetical protein DPMN_051130 [Dreissena polymorpha]|uniref:Uncharacterized protein n=1 Tax=Dreissena polymorpha TaxID=45954 RepID=A0A9D4CIG7_DREPO|nr:hypothetical protein DPMN_051130 [Dreissena polymorpha]